MGKKGSRAHTTGSHVIWKGKPLTKWKKGSRAQGSHVVLETADQLEKGIVGSGKSRGFGNRGPVGKRDRGLREVTWFEGETADQLEKGIVGSQTAGENAGAKSKVQVGRRG